MADQVITTELVKSNHKSGFVFSSKSDGTGEADVTKIDISTLPGAPERVKITKLCWTIAESMTVAIRFDRTGSDPVIILSGADSIDIGGLGPIVDYGSGLTGDIKFTTAGQAANDGYVIQMEVEKQA